jgi:cell division protein FtsB
VAVPRRPAAGRRPASSRGRAGRATRTGFPRGRGPRTPAQDSLRSGLTHRAAVLGLVVTTLVLSAALPLREFLDQRSAISQLEQDSAAASERVAALEEEKRRLQDPAHLAAEARRRLHMARPGEVAYVLIPPTPAPESQALESDGGGPDAPWWSQVWDSVQTADRPPQPAVEAPSAPGPKAAPVAPPAPGPEAGAEAETEADPEPAPTPAAP